MGQQVFRLDPAMGPEAYKTYQIAAPISTHTRSGSCKEAGCLAYQHGWQTSVDESSELGRRQAHYIRRQSGRAFKETNENGFTTFMFEAGQRCFAEHRISLDRPALFIVKGGDWRGNPTGIRPRRHARPEDWVEDFAEHQQTLADELDKG